MDQKKDLVFITSGGRTGTMFFGRNLASMIEECRSVHEPDLKYGWRDPRTWRNIGTFGVWHMLVGRILGRTGGLAIALNYLSGRTSHEEGVRRVRASRARYHRSCPEPLIVEANFQWAPILPLVRDAFPRAKIVAITRDEDAWVGSWLRKGRRHTPRDRVSPSKRITPVTLGDPVLGPQWPSMSTEARLRWEWRFVDERLREFTAGDELARLYSFEELFLSGDTGAMRDLLDFITTHQSRRYPYSVNSDLLSERVNAA